MREGLSQRSRQLSSWGYGFSTLHRTMAAASLRLALGLGCARRLAAILFSLPRLVASWTQAGKSRRLSQAPFPLTGAIHMLLASTIPMMARCAQLNNRCYD